MAKDPKIFSDKENHDYGVAVCKKQLSLDDKAAEKAFAHLSAANKAKLVAAGRAGHISEVRELLSVPPEGDAE